MKAYKLSSQDGSRRNKHDRKRWSCDEVQRKYNQVSEKELHQRLAEVLEIMLSSDCQLQESSAFSNDLSSSQNTTPRLQRKRKAAL